MFEDDDQGLDTYCLKYLNQWEKRATVRHLARTRLTHETVGLELFPAAMCPVVAHPEVVALGSEIRHRILARSAANFMRDVAFLEADLITNFCLRVVNQGAGVPLPESARQVVLTVATDESYHAFAAREFLGDLVQLAGIVPDDSAESPIQRALAAVRAAASAELTRPTETMALCFAENFVTEELFGLSRDGEPQGPFQTMLREHMMDEGRHQVFFRRLFRHLWIGLDEDMRAALGRLLPVYLDGFLGANDFEESLVDPLQYAGIEPVAAARIVRESIESEFGTRIPRKSELRFMRNALDLVHVSGVLEHGPTRQALVESGWVDP